MLTFEYNCFFNNAIKVVWRNIQKVKSISKITILVLIIPIYCILYSKNAFRIKNKITEIPFN